MGEDRRIEGVPFPTLSCLKHRLPIILLASPTNLAPITSCTPVALQLLAQFFCNKGEEDVCLEAQGLGALCHWTWGPWLGMVQDLRALDCYRCWGSVPRRSCVRMVHVAARGEWSVQFDHVALVGYFALAGMSQKNERPEREGRPLSGE